MEISLKHFKTILSKELLKQSEKNKVRECDETEKGHFVSYVDEGDESFDVSLTISSDGEVTEHTCDCKNGNIFCIHKASLLTHISTGKKLKHFIKPKKKISESETLLEETGLTELKEWVRDLLAKNKDIELAFIHYFSAKNHEYTTEEVVKLTTEAIKAIVKNKKNIDPTQSKKLIELWTEIHAPVVQNYLANIADENSFLNFHAVTETCCLFQLKININSNKIPKYIEGLLQQSVEYLNNIYAEETWATATGYYIKYIPDGFDKIRMHYLLHLKNLVSFSNEERRKKLVELLAVQYKKSNADNILNGAQYTKIIFELVQEYKLSSEYCHLFQPIRYDNDFNTKLIRLLIQFNHIDLAEKYSRQQIAQNFREEYNIPYLRLLKEIYSLQKDEPKLANVLVELFPHTYDFDDFIHIYTKMQGDEEKKKWRTKILSKARNASRNNIIEATEFCFKLLAYEKKYMKMIEYIDEYTPHRIILQHFEQMVLSDKARLLKAIIEKRESYYWGIGKNDPEDDKNYFPAFFAAMLKHYTAVYLKAVIKNTVNTKLHYSLNKFVIYMKRECGLEEK